VHRLFPYLLLLISFTSYTQSSKQEIVDSIDYYIEVSKDKDLGLDDRLHMGEKALILSKELGNDSLVLQSKRVIARAYLFFDDYKMVYKLSHENLKLAIKLNDTNIIASSSLRLGWYFHDRDTNVDSAYYYYSQSLKLYQKMDHLDGQLDNLCNMAIILLSEKDYLGSEQLIFKAFSILEKLPKNESNYETLFSLYNAMGSALRSIGDVKKSMEWEHKALKTSIKTTEKTYNKVMSQNNLAEGYKSLKQYSKAIILYEDILRKKEDYEQYDPTFYGLVLANLAITKSLTGSFDYKEVKQMFSEAYNIAKNFEDYYAKMGVSYELSKFHFNQQELDSSLKYSKEALNWAKQTNENAFVLDMLLQLSKLETGDKGKAHLYEYITLSDSLLVRERTARNKFARIKFETDQLEAENLQIGKERSLFLYLFMGSLLGLGLLYVIILQRNKNKVLKYEAEQQEYSQELYELMLAQQQQLEKGRTQERMRVAEELHDGILGKLFGARMNLGFLKVDPKTEDEFNGFVKELQHIEKDIRTLSHELKQDAIPLDVNYLDIINELVASYQRLLPFTIDLNIDNTIVWETIDEGVKLQAYRILQEALTNIIKHSEATEVSITLNKKDEGLSLTIKDNGKGFKETTTKGIGIKNMQSRAKRLKGRFTIESVPKKGTSINVHLPLKKLKTSA